MSIIKPQKAIALSKYFEVVNPKYVYLKLTPLKSIRNYNSDKIINTIASIYRSLTQRIVKDNKKYFFTTSIKVSYYIYMERNNVSFYFVIPSDYKTLLKDKISDTWKGVTIEEVDSIPFFQNGLKYAMNYAKKDAFSLSADKRSNVLLSAIMSNVSVMEDGDKVGVLYNFIPTTQRYWRSEYDNIIKSYKEGYPPEKEKQSMSYILKLMGKIILFVGDIITDTICDLSNTKLKKEKLVIPTAELSNETVNKKNSKIVNTQILVLSQSDNFMRANNTALSICESFKTITEDNELNGRRVMNKNINIDDCVIKGVDVMKIAPYESRNFLALPGKELIEEHKINCIDVKESKIPDQLKKGIIYAGESKYRGSTDKVYLCNDKELRNLALCIVGSNRSGKTTLTYNVIDDCLNAGECVILLDFCGNCELSNNLQEIFTDRTLCIDCSDFDNLQGLGYNEVDNDETNIFKRYTNAKIQAIQLMTLINSVNEDEKSLKAKMDRYLEAASLVVFINNGSIKDVFNLLQDFRVRKEFIDRIPDEQKNNLEEYISSLKELDEKSKDGTVSGTKFNLVSGIFDRLSVLKKNSYIELMLKKDCSNNINLLEEMQEPKLICVKMPEDMFTTDTERDAYCTYWFTKIWLSLQLRKSSVERDDHIKVNIVIDELYQVKKCEELITTKLSRMPKFTAKLIVSCHYIDQLKALKSELKSSNASYMIIQGSNVSNYHDLKYEFSNLGFTVEDLLNLKQYHSLNLLSYQDGYWAGVTKLPVPKKKFLT